MLDPTSIYAMRIVTGDIIAGPYVRAACERHFKDLQAGKWVFDEAAAQYVFDFFEECLVLNDGQFDGRPFKLEPVQKFILGSLFGWKDSKTGARRYRRAYIEQGKGNGKALALDTPIPTPGGWSTMGDLKAGDVVFDERGQPCNVIAAHPVMVNNPCYRVTFSDDSEIVADAEHLWMTRVHRVMSLNHRKGEEGLCTTEEIANTLYTKDSSSEHPQGKYNHRICVAGALSLPDADLPIQPYTLGLWLGDGDSDGARITTSIRDIEVVNWVEDDGYTLGSQRLDNRSTSIKIGINDLLVTLRDSDLLYNKHIPEQYLRASYDQRLSLLQGLMDSDGSIAKDGQCEFSVSDRKLALCVHELIRSLGLKCGFVQSASTLDGKRYKDRYRLQFTAYQDQPVFRLSRKLMRQKSRPRTRPISASLSIVGCEPVPSVPVRCIAVDSPSKLFLAGEGMVPTHNTPLVAGIGLFGMISDNEPGAPIYMAATSRDQAEIMFQDAVKMAKASETIDPIIRYSGNAKVYAMQCDGPRQRGSIMKPVAKTVGTKQSGIRPHMALCDEIHEHPDRTIVDMLERGFKFRRQPLLVMITNSGVDRNSICWEEHEHAVNVVMGDADDDRTFSYVCALDPGDDPLEDPSCWIKANPLLGVTITEEYLEGIVKQAKALPGKLNGILRLHFCEWTDAERAWITRATWESIEDPHIQLEDFEGVECCGGLDLSSTRDLTARALVFDDGTVEDPDTGQLLPKLAAFVYAYTPRATIRERELADKAPYGEWIKQGFIIPTPGRVIRFSHVIKDLTDDQIRFQLKAIGYDRYLVPRFEQDAEDMGADLPLLEHPQGWNKRKSKDVDGLEIEEPLWMPGSIDEFEKLILEGRLRVHVNPALRSAVSGATFIESPAGLRRFAKQKAKQRIDMLIALVMGVGTALAQIEVIDGGTVHEQRGRELREQQLSGSGD